MLKDTPEYSNQVVDWPSMFYGHIKNRTHFSKNATEKSSLGDAEALTTALHGEDTQKAACASLSDAPVSIEEDTQKAACTSISDAPAPIGKDTQKAACTSISDAPAPIGKDTQKAACTSISDVPVPIVEDTQKAACVSISDAPVPIGDKQVKTPNSDLTLSVYWPPEADEHKMNLNTTDDGDFSKELQKEYDAEDVALDERLKKEERLTRKFKRAEKKRILKHIKKNKRFVKEDREEYQSLEAEHLEKMRKQ